MKKHLLAILIFAFMAAMAMASNEATWDITFNAVVEPRVEKAEAGGCTLPAAYLIEPIEQDENEEDTDIDWFEAFYANVPTVITVVGDNPAGDNLPIPARAERHGPGDHFGEDKTRYDRLSITLVIKKRVNEGDPDTTQEAEGEITFTSPLPTSGSGPPGGAGWEGCTNTISLPTPHDGEIEQRWEITIGREGPDCNEENEWYESADAGLYSFNIVETVVGQNTIQSDDAY